MPRWRSRSGIGSPWSSKARRSSLGTGSAPSLLRTVSQAITSRRSSASRASSHTSPPRPGGDQLPTSAAGRRPSVTVLLRSGPAVPRRARLWHHEDLGAPVGTPVRMHERWISLSDRFKIVNAFITEGVEELG